MASTHESSADPSFNPPPKRLRIGAADSETDSRRGGADSPQPNREVELNDSRDDGTGRAQSNSSIAIDTLADESASPERAGHRAWPALGPDSDDDDYAHFFAAHDVALLRSPDAPVAMPRDHEDPAHPVLMLRANYPRVVNWMHTATAEFGFANVTLHVATDAFARVAITHEILRSEAQAIAGACLLLACKYAERRDTELPTIGEFWATCGDVFTVRQLVDAEIFVGNALRLRLGRPTAHSFATNLLVALDVPPSSPVYELTEYATELGTVNFRMYGFRPSEVACAAFILAQVAVRWPRASAAADDHPPPRLDNEAIASVVWCPEYAAAAHKSSDDRDTIFEAARELANTARIATADDCRHRFATLKYRFFVESRVAASFPLPTVL